MVKMPDAVTVLVPLHVIYFFSLEDHSIFSLSLVLSDFLMVCLVVSCFLSTVMDLFQSENSCLQFWNIFLKIISLRILLVFFFLFDNFCHSYIKLPGQNSHVLSCLHFSSFIFSLPFSQFLQNFSNSCLLSKTVILSSLLYFKIPTQLFFVVVVPFIQQRILASWMQYLSSFFHSLFPQSYFSSLFVCVSVFQLQEFFRGLVIASHFLPSAFIAIIISELTYQPLVFFIF